MLTMSLIGHKADNPAAPVFVRYWSNSGHAERGATVKNRKLETA